MAATQIIMLYKDEHAIDVEAFNNNDISILAGSEDPYRAAMVLDILKFNTAINTMICKGIEGRHYVDLGDGYYENGPDYKSYAPDGMSWAWALQNDNWHVLPNRQDQIDWEEFVRAHCQSNPTCSFVFDSEPVSAYYAAVQAAIEENIYTIGLGLVDDPAVALADFIDTLNASGLEKFVDEYKAQYQAWYDMQ